MVGIAPLLAGFFPPTTVSTVKSVNGSKITLSRPLPANGMSAAIIHRLGTNREAVTAVAVQSSPGKAVVKSESLLEHDNLPIPKSIVAVGDKVIGGYLYNNVLVIAPNAQTYAKVTKSASKQWIHPDIYAAFLAREGDSVPNKENLAEFAKEAQVGLVYIVKRNEAVLLDPVSGDIVSRKAFKPVGSASRYPFYMRFDKLKGSLFSGDSGDYYKSVEAIR